MKKVIPLLIFTHRTLGLVNIAVGAVLILVALPLLELRHVLFGAGMIFYGMIVSPYCIKVLKELEP